MIHKFIFKLMIKPNNKTILSSSAIIWLSFLFISCSNEKAPLEHKVPSKDKLISCDIKRNGEIWLVMDKNQEYRCLNGQWVLQEVQKNSSSSTQGAKLSIETISAYLEDSLKQIQNTDSLSSSSSAVEVSSSSSPKKEISSSSISSSSAPVSSSSALLTDSIPVDTLALDSSAIADSIAKADSLCAEVPAGTLCDKRDGKIYPLVRIGSQTWLAKNLNFNAPNSFCYANNTANCSRYGRLYQWNTALGLTDNFNNESADTLLAQPLQGICPEGYRIPTSSDFQTISDYIDSKNGNEGVGTSLKKEDLWENLEEIPQGTNRFGFNALPAGYRDPNGNYNLLGEDLSFWVSEEASSPKLAPFWNLYAENDKFIGTYTNSKKYAYSVRCIKD